MKKEQVTKLLKDGIALMSKISTIMALLMINNIRQGAKLGENWRTNSNSGRFAWLIL